VRRRLGERGAEVQALQVHRQQRQLDFAEVEGHALAVAAGRGGEQRIAQGGA
jgi:hypothetical protein